MVSQTSRAVVLSTPWNYTECVSVCPLPRIIQSVCVCVHSLELYCVCVCVCVHICAFVLLKFLGMLSWKVRRLKHVVQLEDFGRGVFGHALSYLLFLLTAMVAANAELAYFRVICRKPPTV